MNVPNMKRQVEGDQGAKVATKLFEILVSLLRLSKGAEDPKDSMQLRLLKS
jgi:hypothetical protein